MWLLLAVAALPALRLMQSALLRVLNIGPGKVDPIAAALFQTSDGHSLPKMSLASETDCHLTRLSE